MSATTTATLQLVLELFDQIITKIERWDLGESVKFGDPVTPWEDYARQAGVKDAAGKVIVPVAEFNECWNHHRRLCEESEKRRRVVDPPTKPREVWGDFERLCARLGDEAEKNGWVRPVNWRWVIGEGFDPRVVLKAGQAGLYRSLLIADPYGGPAREISFDYQIYEPFPRQRAQYGANQIYRMRVVNGKEQLWPPRVQPHPPIRNEMTAWGWQIHNDDGKEELLELLRVWRQHVIANPSGGRVSEAKDSPSSEQPRKMLSPGEQAKRLGISSDDPMQTMKINQRTQRIREKAIALELPLEVIPIRGKGHHVWEDEFAPVANIWSLVFNAVDDADTASKHFQALPEPTKGTGDRYICSDCLKVSDGVGGKCGHCLSDKITRMSRRKA